MRVAASEIEVAIVGAGFGGIGAGIRLRQHGFHDFLIFERPGEVGGTWRDNTYPGCACDVPSHLYSYSFARNPSWSDTFSGQAEIWDYLRRYVMGCKRVLLSNDYWASLDRDNVDVVAEPIVRVAPDGVVTAGDVHLRVDTIILGTGFRVTDSPTAHQVRGRDGITLAQAWTPTMRAHLGTTVHGFPNLFLLLGPNTGLGHTSVVLMIEAQLRQVIRALNHLRRTGAAAIEPTRVAQRRYAGRVDAKMAGTVWTTGCASWYLDATGRNSTLWPGYATGFRLRLRRFRPSDHVLNGA